MLYTHALAAVVSLAVGTAAGWQARGWIADRSEAQTVARQATLREETIHVALVETTRRLNAQQEAANAAEIRLRRARVAADAAAADAGGLRQFAADLAARADACRATPAAIGASGPGPGAVLADMLGRMEAHGRELAVEADRRGSAGLECEQRYDALTQGTP